MIIPDVNVLLYAFLSSQPAHEAYAGWLNAVRRTDELGLASVALLGVIRIATNPRVSSNPAPTAEALAFVDALRTSPHARIVEPTTGTWDGFRALVATDAGVRGNLVPDAWLAALAISHGASLATADRGFARFDGLRWFDPAQL